MPRHAGVIADRARAAASTVEQRIGSKERAAVPYHSVPSGPQEEGEFFTESSQPFRLFLTFGLQRRLGLYVATVLFCHV